MNKFLSKIGEGILGAGGCLLYIVFFIIIIFIAGLIINGVAWLSAVLFPWLSLITILATLFTILILLPLTIFKKTRNFSGSAMIIISFIFGLTLWIWAFLLTYILWGFFALFIGLFLFGVGVVPIAILATAFNGMWSTFAQLILLIFMTFGSRRLGIYLVVKSDERKTKIVEDFDDDGVIDI